MPQAIGGDAQPSTCGSRPTHVQAPRSPQRDTSAPHPGGSGLDPLTAAVHACIALGPVPVTARTHTQVTALLGGHPLVAPGVVKVTEWRPDTGSQVGQPADLYAGVARITRARR
jgi:hypothetical protein